MTSDVRRRRPALPPDLEDLEPSEGLWRFAWAWFTRGERVVEDEALPEAPASVAPVEAPEAPAKRRRSPKREAPAIDLAAVFRRRAFLWLTREVRAAGEPRRKRTSKAPSPMSLRERAFLWLTREARAAASAEPKRRRISKAAPALGFRERAFLWLTREVRAAALAEAAATPPAEPRRRRATKASTAWRKRAFLWLTRRPPVFEVEAPAETAPAVEVAPPPPPKRKRAPKLAVAPAPAEDPAIVFRRRAWTWLVEGPSSLAAVVPAPGGFPGGEVARAHLRGVLEALIFASEHPLPARELARLAKAEPRLVKVLLAELVAEYHGRGFRLDEIAGGYVFRTSPAFAPFVREQVAKKPVRMSRAQIETLAIVAYRQPITRPEIDDVRGVDSGAVLKSLLERELVRILGKKDEPGRPMLYGTTPDFLEFFGLRALGDLPTLREFTELTDESKRTYEREMGEEPPDAFEAAAGTQGDGLMGGEGAFRRAEGEAETGGVESMEQGTEEAIVEHGNVAQAQAHELEGADEREALEEGEEAGARAETDAEQDETVEAAGEGPDDEEEKEDDEDEEDEDEEDEDDDEDEDDEDEEEDEDDEDEDDEDDEDEDEDDEDEDEEEEEGDE